MMELNNEIQPKEKGEPLQSDSEGVDILSVSTKSPRSSKAHHGKHSPGKHSPRKGSPSKHDRHSHSGRDGRPKKGGSGGKGTWGGLLDAEDA